MTTASAWQRTIDKLDPDAFGMLVAEDVMVTGAALVPSVADEDDLRVLLGMAALSAYRRLLDTATLEAAMAEEDDEDDGPSYRALETTIESVRLARQLLDEQGPEAAREHMTRILDSWERAHR